MGEPRRQGESTVLGVVGLLQNQVVTGLEESLRADRLSHSAAFELNDEISDLLNC